MEESLTIEQFRQLLLEAIFKTSDIPKYELTDEDWENIHKLSKERYQNWEWNYGKSPKFNLQHSHRFPVGQIDIRLEVNKGKIENVKIFGDFFGVGDVSEVEKLLIGINFEKSAIAHALEDVDVKHYFGNITKEELINLIY